MKSKCIALHLSLIIFLLSCSKEEDIEKPTGDDLYMNFILDGASYIVSNKEYQLEQRGGSLKCNYVNDYIEGNQVLSLWDPTYENYIQTVTFVMSKKVFKDELDLSDESSYTKQVLNAESFGFPTNQNGYFLVYDLENDVFEVARDVSAEGYLSIVTNDEEVYHSTSVAPVERDQSSYLVIDKVIESKGNDEGYDYIIEGRFKVNLLKQYSPTDIKIMEGNFRWPISQIQSSEMLVLCD